MKKRTMALLTAVLLVVGVAIGGTLAWLTATSGTVTNTFTTSDIKITLEETKGGADHTFKMIPGYTIEKDPKVKVEAGSEACFLFVKLEKSANFDTYMTYEMADGWDELIKYPGIYYREVEGNAIGTTYDVLKGNQVTVNGTVTSTDMKAAETTKPTLTVSAYASQLYKNNTEKFSPAEAWENIK